MQPYRRPPIGTPEGCFLSNTVGGIFFLTALLVGGVVGSALDGENGARIGGLVFGLLTIGTPWRRWLLRWWQGWDKNQRPGEEPPKPDGGTEA